MYQQAFELLKDENGQVSFADAIYYAEDMSLGNKIYWLKECVAEGQTEQQARVEALEKLLADKAEQQLMRIANRLFNEICDAYRAGDRELESYLQSGLDLIEKLEKEI